MCLAVSKVHWIEMIRDGGSLAAKFTRVDDASNILFLKLRMENRGRPVIKGKFEVTVKANLGYELPVITDCDLTKRPPDINGKVYSELSGPATLLSWSEARSFVREVERVVENLGEQPLKWFHMIIFVVDNDGCLPPGIEATREWRRYIP